MLEQIAYEVPRAVEQRQVVYQVGDLESLSASVLYGESKNNVKIDGTIETILPQFINDDTVKLLHKFFKWKDRYCISEGRRRTHGFCKLWKND